MRGFTIVALLIFTTASLAEDEPKGEVRPFRVPNGDIINLTIPELFSASVIQPANDLPPVVKLRSKQGNAVSLTVQLLPAPEGRFDTQEKIDAGVERKGARYVSQSVEKKVQLVQLKSKAGIGAYATFTDASLVNTKPQPGEFKIVTTGLMFVSNTLVVFELLSDSVADANFKGAIELLQSGLSLGDASPPMPVAPERLLIQVPLQGWQVMAVAPAVTEFAGRVLAEGFQYQARSQQGFNISMFVEEPKEKNGGHAACFEHYWTLAKRNPQIDQQSVKVSKGEKYVKVAYSMKLGKDDFQSRHANYFFAFRDRWIDLHVSQTPWRESDAALFSRFERSLKYEALPLLDEETSGETK